MTLGILAGNGRYPVLLADRLCARGLSVVVAGLCGQTAAHLFQPNLPYIDVPLGAFKQAVDFFRAHDAKRIFFAGGVDRRRALLHTRPDRAGIRMLGRALFHGDDRLLRAAADLFYDLGIEVADPSPHIQDWFASSGLLAGPPVSTQSQHDIEIARRSAIALGARDRGQAATARFGRVIGLETILGTDALIARKGMPGSVLVKMVKPAQDRRFDLPAVGERTVLRAQSKGIRAVGVEVGGVLLLDKPQVFEACNRAGISLVGLPPAPREE